MAVLCDLLVLLIIVLHEFHHHAYQFPDDWLSESMVLLITHFIMGIMLVVDMFRYSLQYEPGNGV